MPEFRRIVPWALATVLLVVAAGPGEVGRAFSKPMPPLSVSWQVDSSAADALEYGLTLTVLARSPFAEVAVEMAVPEPFTVLEGDLRWAGALAAGEARRVRLRVHASGPGTVTARVTGKTASNVQISRTVSVDVPEFQIQKPAREGGPAPEPPGAPGIREFRSP